MAQRIFLIFGVMLVEMILYHSTQTRYQGKFWFSIYGLKALGQSGRSITFSDFDKEQL